eukprot:RCo035538
MIGRKTRKTRVTADASDPDGLTVVDWNSLESKFQELTSMLNAPSSGLNASQARQKQKQQVEQAIETLLEMAQGEARRLLVEGNAQASVEGGLRSLKLKEAYYGSGSLQLVPCYFHLARTNQFLDKFKQAEEFLSLAQWTILRHPTCEVALKAELHQTFGLLYASDGRLEPALKQLAQATYYLALLNGPHHILTSFGYFDLGNVFAAKANMDSAMAFYEKVKEIWAGHLEAVFSRPAKAAEGDDDEAAARDTLEHRSPASFGEENVQDGLKMIRGIVGLQTERFGLVHPATGRAELILALYFRWIDDNEHAQECLERALEIHKRVYGPQHQTTSRIRAYAADFGLTLPADTSHVLDALEKAMRPTTVEGATPLSAEATAAAEAAAITSSVPDPAVQGLQITPEQ